MHTAISLLPLAIFFSLGLAECGETAKLVCFGAGGGQGQNLDPEDIAYAAAFLRYQGSKSSTPALWTMGPEFDCGEWALPIPGAGGVLALAKHINPRINSSVTYEDLARTIDGGGEDASDEDKKNSLLGACGAGGGMLGVKVNATNPVYHTPEYKNSKAKPEGIIVKLVRAPPEEPEKARKARL